MGISTAAIINVVTQVLVALTTGLLNCCKTDTVNRHVEERIFMESHERDREGSRRDRVIEIERMIPVRNTTPVETIMDEMEDLDLND